MAAKKTTLGASDYVHLHNHTQYSLLDGLTKVPDLIKEVKKQGSEAVAVTDHGTLSGTIEFYQEATANGIKPVIGMETYVAARSLYDREPGKDIIYLGLATAAVILALAVALYLSTRSHSMTHPPAEEHSELTGPT